MSTPAEELEISLPEQTKVPQAPMSRFKQADYVRNIFQYQCERGLTADNLLDESHWAHLAVMLKRGDRIEVVSEDLAFFAELMVLATGRLHAQVELMRLVEFARPKPRARERKLKVEWSGGHHLWRVLSGDDVLRENFETESSAQRWADDHERMTSE